MSVLITIGALVLIGLWAVASYNRLVGLRNQVTADWRQIDVELKRRHDLVPLLVNAVTGAMQFERGTLEAVVEARNRAVTASGPADASRREAELSLALGRLLAVAEQYPDLTAVGNIRELQTELARTENRISETRQSYNQIAAHYNTATEVLPANIIAGFAGFRQAEFFTIADDRERAVPKVDLSGGLR